MNNLINVFLEPRDVFTSLDERNNWKDSILPIIITTVVGLASMVALGELLTEVQIHVTLINLYNSLMAMVVHYILILYSSIPFPVFWLFM